MKTITKYFLFVCLCFGALNIQAQDSNLGKGSSIIKGSIGFAFNKTEVEYTRKAVPPFYYDNQLKKTLKEMKLSVQGEYDILLNRYIYIGGILGYSHERLSTSSHQYKEKYTQDYLEFGPNIGVFFNNSDDNRLLVYTNLSEAYLSNFENTQGISVSIGLGMLIKATDTWAIDFSVNADYTKLWIENNYHYYFFNPHSTNQKDGFLINLRLGITGLFSRNK